MSDALKNVKVVITRAKGQADEFANVLAAAGAQTIYFPTIEFRAPDDLGAVTDAVSRINSYDWVIFTSANGVRFFFELLHRFGKDDRALTGVSTGVVGPKTAAALKEYGVSIDLVPEDYRAEGLISGLVEAGLTGKRILIPRALIGREVLPVTLREHGADVTVAPVYETTSPADMDTDGLLRVIGDGADTVLTFTSGSTAKNFFAAFSDGQLHRFIGKAKIAALSPVTKKVVEKMGYSVDIVPAVYTAKDLAEAIINDLCTYV